jgi:hypothetical protein
MVEVQLLFALGAAAPSGSHLSLDWPLTQFGFIAQRV